MRCGAVECRFRPDIGDFNDAAQLQRQIVCLVCVAVEVDLYIGGLSGVQINELHGCYAQASPRESEQHARKNGWLVVHLDVKCMVLFHWLYSVAIEYWLIAMLSVYASNEGASR